MIKRSTLIVPMALFALGLLYGCDDDQKAEQGEVRVSIYGESFIEDGIPADETADGWSVTFKKFSVTIDQVSVGGETLSSPKTVDLTQKSNGEGHLLEVFKVGQGALTEGSYSLSDIQIEGEAYGPASERIVFNWSFPSAIHYSTCHIDERVTTDTPAAFQITVHADHLLYDSLVSTSPGLGFQAFADADADQDGVVTQAELAAADIGAYDPGNEDVEGLWAWLEALSLTLGHINGEGHCHIDASH